MGSFCSAEPQGGEVGRHRRAGSQHSESQHRPRGRHHHQHSGQQSAEHTPRNIESAEMAESMIRRDKLKDKMSRYAAPNVEFTYLHSCSKGHPVPKARKCHSMTVVGEHTLLLFGGLCTCDEAPEDAEVTAQSCTKLMLSGQMFQYAPRDLRWTQPNCGSGDPPSARACHIAANYEGHMFVFGCHAQQCNSLFEYVPVLGNWVTVDCYGDPPEPVAGASACVAGDVLFIFGGDNGKSVTNRLYSFDFEGRRWGCLKDALAQDLRLYPRRDHSAVIFEDRMLVFGGFATKSDDLEFIEFHAPSRSWRKVAVSPACESPELRGGHSASIYHQFMIIFGGMHHRKFLNDLWVYDCLMETWVPVEVMGGPAKTPCPRAFCASAICGKEFFLHGGTNDESLFRDFYCIDCNEISKACDPSFVAPTVPASAGAGHASQNESPEQRKNKRPMPSDPGYNEYNIKNFSPLWRDVTHRASRIQIE